MQKRKVHSTTYRFDDTELREVILAYLQRFKELGPEVVPTDLKIRVYDIGETPYLFAEIADVEEEWEE